MPRRNSAMNRRPGYAYWWSDGLEAIRRSWGASARAVGRAKKRAANRNRPPEELEELDRRWQAVYTKHKNTLHKLRLRIKAAKRAAWRELLMLIDEDP